MPNQDEIIEKLTNSFSNLISKKGRITISDIQLDVINWACHEIISERNKNIGTGNTININAIIQSAQDTIPIANTYTSAAKLIIKEYTDVHALHDIQEIQFKSTWAPMWDVLRKYFKEIHEISIDNVSLTNYNFKPKRFKRILNGEITEESGFSYELNIEFQNDKKQLTLTLPMGVKTGCVIKTNELSDYYIGDEEDYNIEIFYESSKKEKIKDLTIYQTKTGSELHYFI